MKHKVFIETYDIGIPGIHEHRRVTSVDQNDGVTVMRQSSNTQVLVLTVEEMKRMLLPAGIDPNILYIEDVPGTTDPYLSKPATSANRIYPISSHPSDANIAREVHVVAFSQVDYKYMLMVCYIKHFEEVGYVYLPQHDTFTTLLAQGAEHDQLEAASVVTPTPILFGANITEMDQAGRFNFYTL